MRYMVEAGDDWSEPAQQTISVLCVEDDAPIDTGLLDANGVKLYRMPTREPVGFRSRRGVA